MEWFLFIFICWSFIGGIAVTVSRCSRKAYGNEIELDRFEKILVGFLGGPIVWFCHVLSFLISLIEKK